MATAFRIWDGYVYVTKFEVEGEANPKSWAYEKQSEGYDVEIGTLVWDDNDICSWKWKKGEVKPYIHKKNIITQPIFNAIMDMHEKGMTQTAIGLKLNINNRTVCGVVNLEHKKYRKFKEKRDG